MYRIVSKSWYWQRNLTTLNTCNNNSDGVTKYVIVEVDGK